MAALREIGAAEEIAFFAMADDQMAFLAVRAFLHVIRFGDCLLLDMAMAMDGRALFDERAVRIAGASNEILAFFILFDDQRFPTDRAETTGVFGGILGKRTGIGAFGEIGAANENLAVFLASFLHERGAAFGAILADGLGPIFGHVLGDFGELFHERAIESIHGIQPFEVAIIDVVQGLLHVGGVFGGDDLGEILLHRLGDMDAFLGRHDGPGFAGRVIMIEQSLDRGSIGGRTTDAFFFHQADDAAFAIGGRARFGVLFIGFLSERELLAFIHQRQSLRIFFFLEFFVDNLKTREDRPASFGKELHIAAFEGDFGLLILFGLHDRG